MKPAKQKGKIKIFGASDCYGLTDELSFTLRLTYEMRDEVDEACLRKAVDMLEERFSYLKVSLKKNWHAFYYEKNEKPWVLQNTDHSIPLNGRESNYHLLAFSFSGKTIYINAYHGQLDGTGLYRLGKALIYYYCCNLYGRQLNVPDVALPDDEILPEEYRDAYLHFHKSLLPPEENVPSPQKLVKSPMELDRMGLVQMGKRTSFKLSIPQADLMQYCSSYDGSPVTAIALMAAEAIYRLHPDSHKEIVIGIPVNLRPAMGLKVSHCNTYSKVYINYSKQLRSKGFEMQGTICRGTIIRYTNEALLRQQTRKYCRMLSLLNMIPFTALKQLAARGVADQMKKAETADVTYVGKCEYGEMEQYITAMFTDVDAYGMGLQMLISSFGNKFFISIDQDWEEKVYTNSFLEVLRNRGISYEVMYDGPNDTSILYTALGNSKNDVDIETK
ncbi:MAG: hypothetical protein E7241_09880 [Lachnospiraceae bacterium]|nr:hypothetical protein [Lachnospiraceae bacterium]